MTADTNLGIAIEYQVSTIQYNRDCCIGQKIQVSTWGPDREMGNTCTFLVFLNVGKSEQCLYILERRRPITHLYSPIQSGMYILDALHSSQSKRTEIKFRFHLSEELIFFFQFLYLCATAQHIRGSGRYNQAPFSN
jgi:hypothetical protein